MDLRNRIFESFSGVPNPNAELLKLPRKNPNEGRRAAQILLQFLHSTQQVRPLRESAAAHPPPLPPPYHRPNHHAHHHNRTLPYINLVPRPPKNTLLSNSKAYRHVQRDSSRESEAQEFNNWEKIVDIGALALLNSAVHIIGRGAGPREWGNSGFERQEQANWELGSWIWGWNWIGEMGCRERDKRRRDWWILVSEDRSKSERHHFAYGESG